MVAILVIIPFMSSEISYKTFLLSSLKLMFFCRSQRMVGTQNGATGLTVTSHAEED